MNSSKSPKLDTLKTIIKALSAFIAFLFALMYVTTASYFSAVLFLCISAIAIATMDERLRKGHSFLQRSRTLALICLIVAIVAIRTGSPYKSEKRPEAKQIPTSIYSDILSTYIISNPDEPAIRNMHDLADWESLFHNGSTSGINILSVNDTMYKVLDTVGDTVVVEFRPSYTYKGYLETNTYLNEIENNGQLIDYKVRFFIVKDKIIKATPVIFCLNQHGDTDAHIQKPAFTLSAFEKRKQVAIQRQRLNEHTELMRSQQIARERIAEVERLKEQFKEDCLHSNNASVDLIVYVKRHLHDPGSFKHVYTTYQIVDDYAILLMEYRARNALGALVLSSAKAKVTFDCKIIDVEYIQ